MARTSRTGPRAGNGEPSRIETAGPAPRGCDCRARGDPTRSAQLRSGFATQGTWRGDDVSQQGPAKAHEKIQEQLALAGERHAAST